MMTFPSPTIAPAADFSAGGQELRDRGYTILPSVLAPVQLDRLREAFDRIQARERVQVLDPEILRPSHQVTFVLPAKDPVFRSLPFAPALLSLVREVLGNGCVLSGFNGLSMLPGGTPQALHLDQPESTPGLALNLNAVHALDDFTVENGATRLVPGSHRESWPAGTDFSALESRAISMEIPAGHVLIYNGSLLHAGSQNRTLQPRRAVHLFYCRAGILPHWDFEKSLPAAFKRALTDEERRIYGFGHRPDWIDARGKKQFGWKIPSETGLWEKARQWLLR